MYNWRWGKVTGRKLIESERKKTENGRKQERRDFATARASARQIDGANENERECARESECAHESERDCANHVEWHETFTKRAESPKMNGEVVREGRHSRACACVCAGVSVRGRANAREIETRRMSDKSYARAWFQSDFRFYATNQDQRNGNCCVTSQRRRKEARTWWSRWRHLFPACVRTHRSVSPSVNCLAQVFSVTCPQFWLPWCRDTSHWPQKNWPLRPSFWPDRFSGCLFNLFSLFFFLPLLFPFANMIHLRHHFLIKHEEK